MENLTIIQNTNPAVVVATLARMGISSGEFTNGVFAGKSDIILPSNLAAFKMIDDASNSSEAAFIIGVNSDESVERLNELKREGGEDIPPFVSQLTRANIIGNAVAKTFPERDVVIAFYDTETPVELYQTLSEYKFGMNTIFKGNYGTKKGAGRIEGSNFFERVIGFPLPHVTANILPYAALITEPADAEEIKRYDVIKITEGIGERVRPYMTEGNKLLFRVPASLSALMDESLKLAMGKSGPAF